MLSVSRRRLVIIATGIAAVVAAARNVFAQADVVDTVNGAKIAQRYAAAKAETLGI
jgi:hypothetical protein